MIARTWTMFQNWRLKRRFERLYNKRPLELTLAAADHLLRTRERLGDHDGRTARYKQEAVFVNTTLAGLTNMPVHVIRNMVSRRIARLIYQQERRQRESDFQ